MSTTKPEPLDLPGGWLYDHEARALRELAAGKTVLEMGTWKGRSAVAMAQVAKMVYCIDHFSGDDYTGPHGKDSTDWALPMAVANLKKYEIDNARLMIGPFQDILPLLDCSKFDLIFYDADHDYEPTELALSIVMPQIRPDAVVAVHDYKPRQWPHVCRAVDDACAASGRQMRLVGSLAILKAE